MKSLSVFALFLSFGWAQAAQPQLVFVGQDPNSRHACFLYVLEAGNGYVNVQTSFNHDGATAAPIAVRANPSNPKVLVGESANKQDQIAIFLGSQNDLTSAQSFNLKWLHGNHFHTDRCLNLQVYQR